MNFALAAAAVLLQSPPLARTQPTVNGAKLDVVTADLTHPSLQLRVGLAAGFPGKDESFESMVKQVPGAVFAINGAYFDKQTKLPIGDIWTNGQLARKGLMGTAFCVRADGTIDIRRVVRHKGVDWSEFETALACGPALMLDGAVNVDWQGEGFRDPHVIGRTTRMGVGYKQPGTAVFVRCSKAVTFEEFAQIMKGLGCFEAMNLDSGASRGFFFEGKFIEKPGRKLTNILLVTRQKG